MLKTFTARAGEGKYTVEVLATLTGEGLIVQVLGGEKPHVGAVALSLPRPSLSEPGKLKASTTVVPLYGHRDDEIARPVAEQLAIASGQTVVVVAGVHVDAATQDEVKLLLDNSHQAVDNLLKLIPQKGV
ncbi:MAG: hypothetical protein AB1374_06195 [Bacillota bacterium]